MKVKTILVSQPKPTGEISPFYELEEQMKVKIDFRAFIHVEGVDTRDVRHQKIDITKYTAIILTSRNAVDHFFRIAEEMRYQVPVDLKYFCLSEAVANYLQHHIVYRKRKIYVGEKRIGDLVKTLKKHKNETFLLPTSDQLKDVIPKTLDDSGINWDRVILFKTVISDLSDLKDVFYDILVFFSPIGIESLLHNFPDFKQKDTKIAVFGNVTKQAVEKAGFTCDIFAPSPEAPSMAKALELYIKGKK
ncbi:MAG: uroporphyrinogen-III synthase [Flavobacteriia bacterium]|nr:MAG: uroporphyrinogen-III synthase [Flavobacteriia bacterium]